MSPIEHYFENLLTMGSDIKVEPNKNALSREVQEAVEICADYVKYDLLLGDTKTNMVAMLTELKKEIEEQSLTHSEDNILSEWGLGYNHSVERCGEIIQDKINTLKGEENVDKT